MKQARFAKLLATALLVGAATTAYGADCLPGFFSATGQDPCSDCPAGTYTDLPAQTVCQDCNAGTYQDAAAQTTCQNCDAGKYQDAPAQTTCKECSPGTYQDSMAATVCLDCTPGEFSTGGAPICEQCPRGTYQESSAASTCDDCSAGTYNPSIGAASAGACQDCTEGTYGASPALSTCSDCMPGTYSNTTAATACSDCSPGKYSDTSAATICQDCAAETYSSTSAATTCEDCPPLTYQPDTGASFCYDRDSVRCWKAKDLKNPKFVQQDELPVSDDFADDTVDLKKAALFCAPVAVSGQPVTDSNPRRCCYKAKGNKLDPFAEIEVAGSLGGTLQLALKKPSLLCDQCQGTPGADPLRCWKVKDLKNPKFVKQEDVSAADELATDTFDTKKPDLYCAPASVNGALVADSDSQQCCYKVKGAKLSPEAVRTTAGDIGGSLELEMKKQFLVCEPCTKIDLP